METNDSFGFVSYLIGRGLSDKTIRVYGNAVERWLIHCAAIGLDPIKAGPMEMRTYSEGLPNTAGSRRQHAVALGHWYRYMGLADGGPTGAIRKPVRRRMRWNGVNDDVAAAIVQVSRGVHPEGTAALLMLLMGLRREETAKVEWPRFSPDLCWYDVLGKGNLEERIPVHEIVREQIGGRQSAYRYLFPGQRSAYVNPGTVSVWIGEIGRAAGIADRPNREGQMVPGLSPHKLRHTFISDINDKTGDLRTAQVMARHASPETTAGYTRVTDDKMIAASRNLSFAPVRSAVNQ